MLSQKKDDKTPNLCSTLDFSELLVVFVVALFNSGPWTSLPHAARTAGYGFVKFVAVSIPVQRRIQLLDSWSRKNCSIKLDEDITSSLSCEKKGQAYKTPIKLPIPEEHKNGKYLITEPLKASLPERQKIRKERVKVPGDDGIWPYSASDTIRVNWAFTIRSMFEKHPKHIS